MKEKVLLCIVAIAALCVAFYFLMLTPQLSSIDSIKTTLADKQSEVAKYKNFDLTIENTSKEVTACKAETAKVMQDWHNTLIQHDIMTDLEDKIRDSKLYDTNITFTNVQQMNIVTAKDLTAKNEAIPDLSESLALAYLCLVNKDTKNDVAAGTSESQTNSGKSGAAKGASGSIVLNPEQGREEALPDVPPELTTSFETFKQSLDGLSDDEIRSKVYEIMAESNTNIQKLDISVAFQDSTYQSILSFLSKIYAENPKIYVTSISYSNSTDNYISKLNAIYQQEQEEAAQKAKEEQSQTESFFSNVYPSAQTTRSQINPRATLEYKGVPRYTGSITISYFSLVKMPIENINPDADKTVNSEATGSVGDEKSAKL